MGQVAPRGTSKEEEGGQGVTVAHVPETSGDEIEMVQEEQEPVFGSPIDSELSRCLLPQFLFLCVCSPYEHFLLAQERGSAKWYLYVVLRMYITS